MLPEVVLVSIVSAGFINALVAVDDDDGDAPAARGDRAIASRPAPDGECVWAGWRSPLASHNEGDSANGRIVDKCDVRLSTRGVDDPLVLRR